MQIVPAPKLDGESQSNLPLASQPALLLNELRRRHELDDDEAETLAQAIRTALESDAKVSKL